MKRPRLEKSEMYEMSKQIPSSSEEKDYQIRETRKINDEEQVVFFNPKKRPKILVETKGVNRRKIEEKEEQ